MMKRVLSVIVLLGMILMPILAQGQTAANIVGKVTDESGNPLPGANVFVEGMSYGAATNSKGEYSFVVPRSVVKGQEVTLVARFVGYKTRSVKIVLRQGTIVQDFQLPLDVLELESVVVTGMGIGIEKEKLGVTIAKVKPKIVAEADHPNLVSALHGKVSNVEIVRTSGDPGTNAFIRIRGGGSIDRGTQPLFVVDGTPIDNSTRYTGGWFNGGTEAQNRASDINPEDIESIEILKGAAASAIYGSRAANGVVLITTKGGRPGKTQISYKSAWGLTQLTRSYPLQTWYGQGTGGEYKKDYLRSYGRPLNVPGAPHFDPSKPIDKVYDHSREGSNGGWIADNTISISGGNDLTTFYASFGHYYEKGHWEAGSDYTRYTARLKASQVLSSKMKITGNLSYVHTDANYLQRGDNAEGMGIAMLRSPPDWNNKPYIDPNTGYHRSYRYSDAAVLRKSRKFNNPYWVMYELQNPAKLNRVFGNGKLDYDPFKFLNVSYVLGIDSYTDYRMRLRPPGGTAEDGNGDILKDDFKYLELDGTLTATFQANRLFPNLRHINASLVLGHNFNKRRYHRFEVEGNYIAVPGFNQLDNTVDVLPDEYEYAINTEAYFGQATVDLFDQLYLTGAFRNEGSTTFGKAQKRHWYPKFSAAWEFTKFQKIPYLDFGKLRFAWGQAGVQPGVYSTLSGYATGERGIALYTSTALNFLYMGKSGYYSLASPPNDHIKPERTTELEVGTNLGFWNHRLGLELTYYRAVSSDVLLDINLVPSTGYFDRTDNAAEIVNSGWEATLDLFPIQMKNFTWNLTLNWARNRNEVTKFPENVQWEQVSRWGYAAKGHPLGEFRTISWVRFGYGEMVEENGQLVNIDEKYAGQWKKNDVYVAADGYPIVSNNRYWTGFSPNPDWTGSIRSEFRFFNNFSFSVLFDIVNDYYIMNHGRGALYAYGTHKDTENRWIPQYEEMGIDWGIGPINRFFHHGEKAVGPGAQNGVGIPVKYTENWYRNAGGGFSGDGWQFIENAGYVKLREISLAYTFRHPFIRQFGFDNIRVRLSGRNLYTWTDYTGWDPETNRRQATGQRGGDYFNQPQTRQYTLTFYFNM